MLAEILDKTNPLTDKKYCTRGFVFFFKKQLRTLAAFLPDSVHGYVCGNV